MIPTRVLLFLLVGCLSAIPGSALDWKVRQLSIKAVALQKSAEVSFEFTNSSAKTVTILDVATSCDCTEATPSAQTFAAGASGRITARFTLGDIHGVYERTITVATDEGNAPATLQVELDVPAPASLTPRSVDWKLNQPATEQSIEIRVVEGLELAFTQVHSTSGRFTTRLETIEPSRHYRLHLAPENTSIQASAAFRLHAKTPSGQTVILSVYGNVR